MKKLLADFLLGDLDREQRTAVWRIALACVFVGHVSWACGWLPGIPGFAMAAEQDALAASHLALSGTVNRVEVSLLEKDIIEAQERFCKAALAGNTEAQRYAEERRRRLLQEWQDMKGQAFDLPSCSELGIA